MPPDGSYQASGLGLLAHFDLISTSSSYDSWHPCPISEKWRHEKEKYWLILPTTTPRGLFVHFSRLIESLSHYAAASAQVCDHRARPFSNLSTFSPSVKFSLSDESSLDKSFFHLETSLFVKLAQKITWSEHFPPRCVFSNLSNFDWRVFMHCY